MSPTARTLAYYRANNIPAGVVERYCSHTRRRHDLLGFIDLVAVSDSIIGVQVTSGSNASSRVDKILTECHNDAIAWLKAGGRIQVWGWTKYKKPIERKFWRPRVIEIKNMHSILVAEKLET